MDAGDKEGLNRRLPRGGGGFGMNGGGGGGLPSACERISRKNCGLQNDEIKMRTVTRMEIRYDRSEDGDIISMEREL